MGRHKRNALIQKEQIQLLKVQKELDNILERVNETINELKVEELQLKSNAAAAMTGNSKFMTSAATVDMLELPSTSANSTLVCATDLAETRTSGVTHDLDTFHINRQQIDLNIAMGHGNPFEEEEDDD